jgi:NADH-quinone oxidoreductase subunit G
MRVWFLKETRSFCTSCATGCNTVIGSRENIMYRMTPRENNDVNSVWMCDYGRLNFHYLNSPERLLEPMVKGFEGNEVTSWEVAISRAATELKKFASWEVAIIASGTMTNEELFLTRRLGEALRTDLHDIVPHTGEGDDILLSVDRNPNTAGAKLLGVASEKPGARIEEISTALKSGRIKALIALGEDATAVLGDEIANAQFIVAMSMLPNGTTKLAHVVLPSCGFAEKRGSMINKNSRLQRLNRAIQPPGEARDDWEILRDLIQTVSGSNGIYMIEDVFKQMATTVPAFGGLSLSKIGDLGVQLPVSPATGQPNQTEHLEANAPVARTPTV